MEFCGLRIKPSALTAVIAQDSQEGTEFSRARQVEPGSDLTDERLASFRDCLAKLAPSLTLICLWKARMAFAISKRVKFVRREIENRAVNRGAYRADAQLRRFRCRPQTSTDRRETLRSA